jgi:hypothetical protein
MCFSCVYVLGERSFGKPKLRWEDNIKTDL